MQDVSRCSRKCHRIRDNRTVMSGRRQEAGGRRQGAASASVLLSRSMDEVTVFISAVYIWSVKL